MNLKILKNWWSFLRFQNILIVILTQYLLRFLIVEKYIKNVNLSDLDFFILVLITAVIAIGGNIINDIYDYSIDKTLANGARWDMCWTHNNNHGIRYHHIYYTPKNGTRRMVLMDAAVSQIHVPYDDNGARYHDVSDYGLGGGYLRDMSATECPGGTMHRYGTKDAVCSQIENKGAAYRFEDNVGTSQALKVFSISKVGAYVYIPQWLFYDDGRIEPSILATGSLQRFGTGTVEQHGWLLSGETGSYNIGLSHMHNYFWRLDFDINGSASNDVVQEINYSSSGGQRQRSVTTFNNEAARSVSPSTQRSWIVRDGSLKNAKNHLMGYEIRLDEAGHRENGPTNEQFTYNDFYVTRASSCEQIASHNQRINSCATNSLDQFVNGESIVNQDLVAWVGLSFYHMPRSEDAPKMDIHSNHFQIIPRDWHDKNPLVTLQTEPLVANEDTATTPAGDPITVDVLSNDTGTGISITEVDNPAHGTAVVSNGKVVYTPDAGYAGTDVFWYTIKDVTGAVYSTTITISVTGVNAGPYPSGVEDEVSTPRDTAAIFDVLANDIGVGLTLNSTSAWTNQGGRASISNGKIAYTPKAGFAGEDELWYVFSDAIGRTNSARVVITVTGVNVDAGPYPSGVEDTESTAKNTAATFDVLANDIGVGLTLTSTSAWTNKGGRASVSNGKIAYTPKQDFTGEDELWYVFSDVIGRTNSARVVITVTGVGTDAGPYPSGTEDTVSTVKNTAAEFDVLANDVGVGLTLTSTSPWTDKGGRASISNGEIAYTPKTDFVGEDELWYVFTDAIGRTNSAKVTIMVTQ